MLKIIDLRDLTVRVADNSSHFRIGADSQKYLASEIGRIEDAVSRGLGEIAFIFEAGIGMSRFDT